VCEERNVFKSEDVLNRALAEPETSACKIAESRDNTMRVLPVPGGPWMSVMGCFSSAAETARSCDSVSFQR
jgi:hypothetical protein